MKLFTQSLVMIVSILSLNSSNAFASELSYVPSKNLTPALAGGLGGNGKLKEPIIYDGGTNHYPALALERDAASQTCYMEKDVNGVPEVVVYKWIDAKTAPELVSFACQKPDPDHNNVYWNTRTHDSVNGAYSPQNDALFAAEYIINFYKRNYNLPLIRPSLYPNNTLKIITNIKTPPLDSWDGGNTITLGNGYEKIYYPFTTLKSVAYITAQVFSAGYSNLTPYSTTNVESQAVGGAFGDIAAQAVMYDFTGINDWKIGNDIMDGDKAIRYMDLPSKDCNDRPRDKNHICSFDTLSDYRDFVYKYRNDPSFKTPPYQFLNGIFDRAFYLIATSKGWNARKAFNLMVHANIKYWTERTRLEDGGCAVIQASRDLQYDTDTVIKAFNKVGINC